MRSLRLLISVNQKISGSCSDNTSSTSEQAAQEESPPIVEVSYGKGLDVMLIETTWCGYVHPYCIPEALSEGALDGDCMAIYWDQKNHQYYHASIRPARFYDGELSYRLDSNLQLEPVATEEIREIFSNTGSPFLYAGSIEPLKRVYINPDNQRIFIKNLTPVDDSYYVIWDRDLRICITNSLSEPVYPVIYFDDTWVFKRVAYTNSGDIMFKINPLGSFELLRDSAFRKSNGILKHRDDVSILYPREDTKQEEEQKKE